MASRDENDKLLEGVLPVDPFEGTIPLAVSELPEHMDQGEGSARGGGPGAGGEGGGYGGGGGQESAQDALVGIVRRSAQAVFRGSDRQCYAQLPVTAPGAARAHLELLDLATAEWEAWARRAYHAARGKGISEGALCDARRDLMAEAMAGRMRDVSVRVARVGDRVYLDLGDESWRAVEVTREWWKVLDHAPVYFRRPAGMEPLPVPELGGSLDELRPLVNVPSDADWALCLAWLVGCLQGRTTSRYLILVVQGEHGTAKTSLSRMLRRLVDPHFLELRRPPGEERDFAIAAQGSWVLGYENLSSSAMQDWLSDMLCCLATGAGFATRALYKGRQEELFSFCGPALINGIDDLLRRGDLAERSVVVSTPVIPPEERKLEAELWADYERLRPRLLGALLDAVACALRREGEVGHVEHRMADAVRWATAAEPALGLEAGAVAEACARNRDDSLLASLDSEPVAQVLLREAERPVWWQGRTVVEVGVAELLEGLREAATEQERLSKRWPRAAQTLSKVLVRLAPALRASGLHVELRKATGGRRTLLVERAG